MIVTKEQIERLYQAVQANGATRFYIEEDSDGKLRFGAIEVVMKRHPLALSKDKGRPKA